MSKKTCHWVTAGVLSLALFSAETSLAMQECPGGCPPPQRSWIPHGMYLGFFGGGGSATNVDASQRGTAFYSETSAVGGPLAVDAEGQLKSRSTTFWGAHVGYAWRSLAWCLTPAVEVEGFSLRSKLGGTLDAPHTALPEHTFSDSFPINGGVYLINTVFSWNSAMFPRVSPYVGGGIGGAVLNVTSATSSQISPTELFVNHFNTQRNAYDSTFAAQIKAGLRFAVTDCVSLFAEYRYLYLGPTRFDFGSTVYPALGHVPTSPWGVNVRSFHYNLGAAGIEFSL